MTSSIRHRGLFKVRKRLNQLKPREKPLMDLTLTSKNKSQSSSFGPLLGIACDELKERYQMRRHEATRRSKMKTPKRDFADSPCDQKKPASFPIKHIINTDDGGNLVFGS
jgi:hypothetical protein